jgi:hypothetical protein
MLPLYHGHAEQRHHIQYFCPWRMAIRVSQIVRQFHHAWISGTAVARRPQKPRNALFQEWETYRVISTSPCSLPFENWSGSLTRVTFSLPTTCTSSIHKVMKLLRADARGQNNRVLTCDAVCHGDGGQGKLPIRALTNQRGTDGHETNTGNLR